jgi:hypothetical protein
VIHARIINLWGGEVVCVACTCEAWSVTLPARSGVLKVAIERHDEHLATISAEPMPPSEQREQEGSAVSPGAAEPSDHQDKGTPAVHAEVPVMSPRTGSEAR